MMMTMATNGRNSFADNGDSKHTREGHLSEQRKTMFSFYQVIFFDRNGDDMSVQSGGSRRVRLTINNNWGSPSSSRGGVGTDINLRIGDGAVLAADDRGAVAADDRGAVAAARLLKRDGLQGSARLTAAGHIVGAQPCEQVKSLGLALQLRSDLDQAICVD